MNPYDKMRNALIEAKCWLLECLNEDNPPTKDSLNEAIDRIDAALSEPPRQCDVGTAEDQFDRFAKHCIGKDCGSCEHGDGVRGRSLADCALRWAQTPYAQEGAGR